MFILSSDYGSVTAQTVVGATCNLRAALPNGLDAAGVENPKVAGPGGYVGWGYPLYATDSGNGLHIVTCAYNGLSGVATAWFSTDG